MSRLLAIGTTALALASGCNAILGFESGQPAEPAGGSAGQTTTASGGTGGAGGESAGGSGGTGLGPIEQPCDQPDQCPAGYLCVDGYCCTTDCTDLCEACNIAGRVGTCSSIPPATDPDEECAAGVCDGSGECAIGSWIWSNRYGDVSDDQLGLDVAVDGLGDVYLTGSFRGAVSFGGTTFDAVDKDHAFIAKLNASHGVHLWSHMYGGDSHSAGFAVAADDADRVVLAGWATYGVDFGCGSHFGGLVDVFVAMLHANDQCTWSDVRGHILNHQVGRGVALDDQGNTLLAGSYFGGLGFGDPALPTAEGEDAFLAKLDPAGQHVWSRSFGAANDQQALAVATHAGAAVIAGWLRGEADFGGGPLTSSGGSDVFVASLDDAGAHQWSRRFGDDADQEARGLTIDGAGNAIVVGEFEGELDFGDGPLSSAGANDIFIAKLDPGGSLLWSQSYGDVADQRARAVAVDGSNNIIVVGSGAGSLDLGGGSYGPLGGEDIFVGKYAPDGTHLWSQRVGSGGEQIARSVAVDGDGHVVITGQFENRINFSGASHDSLGGTDIFVVKLAP